MAAIRGARGAEGKFVQLRNAAGQDERLSLEARGIIFLVLSLPVGQRFTRLWLVERVAGRNGRRSVDKALDELEQYGYFRKTPPTSAGRGKWMWEDQVITDDPALLTSETLCPGLSSDRFRQDDNRSDELTCDDASSETLCPGLSSDRLSPDDNRSDKDLKEEELLKDEFKDGRDGRPADDPSSVADAMSRMIIGEMQDRTGAVLSRDQAERIGAALLAGRPTPPDHPVEWTKSVIRAHQNPRSLLPTPTPPKYTAPPRKPPPSPEAIAAAHEAIAHLERPAVDGEEHLRNVAAEQLAELRAGRKKIQAA
jgi:hypothetical protein